MTINITKELLAKRAEAVRTGGKGSVRRKSKGVHRAGTNSADDKKLQGITKRLGVTGLGDVEEVTFHRSDGTSATIRNPRVEANIPGSAFVIRGKPVQNV
ncbi:basic transcription factor 3a [Perkinsela sp. CCAP 1560/4]|nr:basic transcription factor 3a [Perkinsela sp. CCAP 1560/4]|eukprot:KNH04056.1 basic transcription factor 3a [Perkinsela sp. CCAP 1560/4]